MTHACEQISAATAVLLSNTPTVWGEVFETRLPSSRAVMPYLLVFDDGEPLDAIAPLAPGIYQRDLNLVVAARLRLPGNNDTETVERRINTVLADIETRLTFQALLATLPQLKGLRLVSVEKVVVTKEDDTPQYAELTLIYVARYYTAEGAPETLI